MAKSTKRLYTRRGGVTVYTDLYTSPADFSSSYYLCVRSGAETLYAHCVWVSGDGVPTGSHLAKIRKSGGYIWVKNNSGFIAAGTYTQVAFMNLIKTNIANLATRSLVNPVRIRRYGFSADNTNITKIKYFTQSGPLQLNSASFNGRYNNGTDYALPQDNLSTHAMMAGTTGSIILRDNIVFI